MLSIVTSVEADDARVDSCLRRLWLVAHHFEHVIVLNNCSPNFTLSVKDLLHEAPPHVTTVLVEDLIQVARQGLEELLTPPNNEHSRLQFEQRCFSKCSNPWIMSTTPDFVATPNWIEWFNSLELGLLGKTQPVAISMHSRSGESPLACRRKLFNFVPTFRRHYWWPVLDAPNDVLSIQNVEADSFESLKLPQAATEPWFAGQEPTLESAWSYTHCLLPENLDHRRFITAITTLFAPDGTWRDSRHSRWVDTGAAAIDYVREAQQKTSENDPQKAQQKALQNSQQAHPEDVKESKPRAYPVLTSAGSVSSEEASAYWAQIKDFEFQAADLQPICTACDLSGNLVPEEWPDGLLASAITLKHLWHALFIMDRIWDVKTVVEVGAGYGGFAKAFLLCAQLCDRVVESYKIVELPAVQPLCEQYLQDHQSVSFANASLSGSDLDAVSLFVSLDGVSEFANEQKQAYLDTLLPRAKNVCLLWNCTHIPDELYDYHATMDVFLPDSRILIYGRKL